MRLLKNKKAAIGVSTVIMLAIGFLLVAILVPIAMVEIAKINATTGPGANWNAAVLTIFTVLLPLLVIIGVAIRYIPTGKGT